jgi:hypothetical protein
VGYHGILCFRKAALLLSVSSNPFSHLLFCFLLIPVCSPLCTSSQSTRSPRYAQIKVSIPTWVPSIITGITSSVTTFKTLPKNKQDLFDFSVAGPLVGMLASVAAIAVGSQLTLATDPSMLPALPLEILRQSTLGGGIINTILGNGVLNIPEGALGSSAIAGMTIPLHPVAIAGYIALVVNALCLLPIGSKCYSLLFCTVGIRACLCVCAEHCSISLLFFLSLSHRCWSFYFRRCSC